MKAIIGALLLLYPTFRLDKRMWEQPREGISN